MAGFCDERLLIGTFTNEDSVGEVGEDGKGESGDVKLARCFVRSSPFAPHVVCMRCSSRRGLAGLRE